MPEPIINGLAWFLAWLFIAAGFHKLQSAGYYVDLMQRHISWPPRGKSVVRLIAIAELGIGALLILSATRVAGLLGCIALLLAYSGLLTWQLARGQTTLPCGCAGPTSSLLVSRELVWRNIICAAVALIALAPSDSIATGVPGLGLSVCVAIFLALLYATSEQLLSNAQRMAAEH